MLNGNGRVASTDAMILRARALLSEAKAMRRELAEAILVSRTLKERIQNNVA